MNRRLLAASLLAVLAASCGDTGTAALQPLNLERPVDISFACFGGLRIVGDDADGNGNPAEADDPVAFTAQPMESCRIRSVDPDLPTESIDVNGDGNTGDVPYPLVGDPKTFRPLGQEDIDGQDPIPVVEYFAFILQSAPGTLAMARFPTAPPTTFSGVEVVLFDADELTPGRNAIVVGSLPVAMASDRAGCHAFTANAGSCDLSRIGIPSFVDEDPTTRAELSAVTVTNAAGEDVLARPAAMIAEPAETTQPIGVECPAEPEGLLYIAYPDCHIVAAVRSSTGQIEAAVRFNPDGTVDLTNGNVSCPAQCGGGGTFVAGERPVTVDLVHDARVGTRRLVIGAEDSPSLTVVELDAGYLPTSFSRVLLEGDVGVLDVAMTPQIGMGGSSGIIDDAGGAGGDHQFVYAVASDATIRVADVFGTNVECDTQVDPRYLRGITDVGRLACLPVGDVATPPRRALARGPGIDFVGGTAAGVLIEGDSVPLSVAVVSSQKHDEESGAVIGTTEPRPDDLVGYFAFVTTAAGGSYILNIDDDSQVDFWDPGNPLGTMVAHVVPHQTRDETGGRGDLAQTSEDNPEWDCSMGGVNDSGGPRLIGDEDGDGSISLQDFDQVTSVKSYMMPGVRNVLCEDDEESLGKDTPEDVAELAFAAQPDQRDLAFPDLRTMRDDETWTFTWEGPLSRDDSGVAIDGPSIRYGLVERDGNLLSITDGTRPFCSLGAQRFDIAVLTGCDPDLGDQQCGVGQRCYVHPESTVSNGACLPSAQADTLAATCRDFLVSLRRYSISSAKAGELRIMPRRRILTTTPIEGCVDDNQCAALGLEETKLASNDHPIDWEPDPSDPARTYTCGLDPTRGGPDRCMMTCEDDTGCDEGTRCSNGWCVEGVVPPAECLAGVQRYQVRGGDALIVVGDLTGHLHPIIEDTTTGECVVDPTAHPLLVGRIPLDPPPCPGPDAFDAFAPNPCMTTVEHTGMEPAFGFEDGVCTGGDEEFPDINPLELVTRDAPAIRFKNPALTYHLVDPWYPGDLNCRGDRAAGLMLPVLRAGYQLQLRIVSGFNPSSGNVPAVFPVNVVRGPEESIWVIDEGDDIPQLPGDPSTRGQVFRVEPSVLGPVNTVQ